mgnify:CR=1 FL=1
MKLSVVIPLYNKESTIVKCLNSVTSQTLLPNEIIIINDGSTDSSAKLVETIIANHLHLDIKLIDQVNKGVSQARNLGIKTAKNELIALLDADDEWHKDYTLLMGKLIQNYPDAGIYSSFHKKKDADGNFFLPFHILQQEFMGYIPDYFETSIKVPLINSSCVILSKSCFVEQGGFKVGAKVTEDLLLWFKFASNYKVAHINKPLVTINQFPDNSRKNRKYELPVIIEYFNYNRDIYKNLNKSQKRYLFSVSNKQIIGSLLDSNYLEYFKRLKLSYKLFGIKSFRDLLLLFITPYGLRFIRNFKRKLMSRNTLK